MTHEAKLNTNMAEPAWAVLCMAILNKGRTSYKAMISDIKVCIMILKESPLRGHPFYIIIITLSIPQGWPYKAATIITA